MPQHTRWQDFQRTPLSARTSALAEMRQKMHQHVISELGQTLYDQRISETELRRQVHELLHTALGQERAALTSVERTRLIQGVSDDVLGYGLIERFLKDPTVTEVMVNGPDRKSVV